jgi:hypothetical protein
VTTKTSQVNVVSQHAQPSIMDTTLQESLTPIASLNAVQ